VLAAFETGTHFHVLPDEVLRRRAGWILRQYKQVIDYKRREAINAILTTENGVGRALFPIVNGKPAPPLGRSRISIRKPTWMKKYEEANKKHA